MLKKEIPTRSHSGEFRRTNKTNKKYLSKDFHHRCGYCDDIDSLGGGYKTYHVEHFAPKEKFPNLEFVYENLLYSCPYCNESKNDDWPSDDSMINIVGNCGYIDPCNDDYYNHLDRDKNSGEIYYKTELGKYMYNKLKLYLKRHSLIYLVDKVQERRHALSDSIEEDKKKGINTSQKEKLLALIDDEFFRYFSLLQKEQCT